MHRGALCPRDPAECGDFRTIAIRPDPGRKPPLALSQHARCQVFRQPFALLGCDARRPIMCQIGNIQAAQICLGFRLPDAIPQAGLAAGADAGRRGSARARRWLRREGQAFHAHHILSHGRIQQQGSEGQIPAIIGQMQHARPGAQPAHQQIRPRRAGEARDQGDFRLRIQRGQGRQFCTRLRQYRRADAARRERSLPPPKPTVQIARDGHGNALLGQIKQCLSREFKPTRRAALQHKGCKIGARHPP